MVADKEVHGPNLSLGHALAEHETALAMFMGQYHRAVEEGDARLMADALKSAHFHAEARVDYRARLRHHQVNVEGLPK